MRNVFVQTDRDKRLLQTPSLPCFGTVEAYQGGKAKIVIDGDASTNGIWYECLQSCTPSAGDRVFFVRTGSTLVILGVLGNKSGG